MDGQDDRYPLLSELVKERGFVDFFVATAGFPTSQVLSMVKLGKGLAKSAVDMTPVLKELKAVSMKLTQGDRALAARGNLLLGSMMSNLIDGFGRKSFSMGRPLGTRVMGCELLLAAPFKRA